MRTSILLLGLFVVSSIVAALAASGCKNNDHDGYELPEGYPERLEQVTYNSNVYEVDKVIAFNKCIEAQSHPPGITEEERLKMKEKVSVEFVWGSSNVPHDTYGFDIASVCNKIGAEDAESSDFDTLIGSHIGEALTASDSYRAYSLTEIEENQAIAITLTLTTDVREAKFDCCADCYIKYVRQE